MSLSKKCVKERKKLVNPVKLNPPLGLKWYSPVIFHAPHCPRMWVWPNVSGKRRVLQFSSLLFPKSFYRRKKVFFLIK